MTGARSMRRGSGIVLAALLGSTSILAQAVDIPLANWTVPPYPQASPGGGYRTMVDQTPPRAFIGLVPCRLLDTRNSLNPLGGGGAFAANEMRTYTIPPHCGIPVGADSVSLNITATNAGPQAFGHVKIWPYNQLEPTVSTLNYRPGATVSNAAIVALGTDFSTPGRVRVLSGNAGADLIIDANGYFSDTLGNPGNGLIVITDSFSPAISVGTPGAFGAHAEAYSGTVLSGVSNATSGVASGVYGFAADMGDNSAGVKGIYGAVPDPTFADAAGVRGEGFLGGVVGISREVGVAGSCFNSAGGVLSEGYLGIIGGPNYGAYSTKHIQATGTKFFVEPHPTDASKVIRYASLEGPEPGTYFRGRGRFAGGTATIAVPEHFRMVTDAEGLTVQVTPLGGLAAVAVLRADLNEIVVRSSRDLDFYYTVNGVRRSQKEEFKPPIQDGTDFMPRSADARIPLWLTDEQKRFLIRNGTYREDGSVNMETARRLGWDRLWEQRARPAPQPPTP